MKNVSKKNLICLLVILLISIAGIAVLLILGFEKSILYQAGTRIEIYIPKGYEKQDILNIAKESFEGEKISFAKAEKLDQVATIKLKEYTEEELDKFKSKICEKYDIDKEKLELYEILTPAVKVSTIVKPYVAPILLVTILSLR